MLVHDELSIRAETKGTNKTANKDDMKRLRMVIVDRTLAADAWFCPQAQRLPGARETLSIYGVSDPRGARPSGNLRDQTLERQGTKLLRVLW